MEELNHSNPQTFTYKFRGNTYTFISDAGVFSVGKMDKATEILLQNIPALNGSLLDMGCGYGCIGIILAKENNLKLSQADINPRAIKLSQLNAANNNIQTQVIQSDHFSQIKENFNTITLNPPIHAGKNLIFTMYEESYRHLLPGGSLYIVIQKKHGAESSIKRLNEIFGNCEILYKKKGYYILRANMS